MKQLGDVQLVPGQQQSGKKRVTLQGAQGYNNAVQLLDAACSALYSNPQKGITARSIDMDDIEPLLDPSVIAEAKNNSNHNSKSYLNENDQISSAFNKNYSFFPRIYEEEIKSVINGNEKTSGLSQSAPGSKIYSRNEAASLSADQLEFTNSIAGYLLAKTNIQPYHTYYSGTYGSISLNTAGNYLNSLQQSGKATQYASLLANDQYWVATRYINVRNSSYCEFGVYRVLGGGLNYYCMFQSHGDCDHYDLNQLFPIVTVKANLIQTNGNAYSISQ